MHSCNLGIGNRCLALNDVAELAAAILLAHPGLKGKREYFNKQCWVLRTKDSVGAICRGLPVVATENLWILVP